MLEENNFKIRDTIKIKIVHDLIEPFYLDDIKSMIRGKKYWKLSGQIFETVSKVLVAIGGIMSFSSGYFNDPMLSFLAGSISTLSLATLQFSSFAYVENKKQGQDLNVLLKKLNLDVIPVLERRTDSAQPPTERRISENFVAMVSADEAIVSKIDEPVNVVINKDKDEPFYPKKTSLKQIHPLAAAVSSREDKQQTNLKITLKNTPPPPSADDGLIVSEFIPQPILDLKEQKTSI